MEDDEKIVMGLTIRRLVVAYFQSVHVLISKCLKSLSK